MQNAKDSFYEELRGRLATLNPQRTIYVRGVTRPGSLVDENELANAAGLTDCFHLNWVADELSVEGELPLVALRCEIRYATAGSAANGGLDRGRQMGAMDGELLAAIQAPPQNTQKMDFSGLASGDAVATMGSRVWWSNPSFGPVKREGDRLTRITSVDVMSFEEEGEL